MDGFLEKLITKLSQTVLNEPMSIRNDSEEKEKLIRQQIDAHFEKFNKYMEVENRREQ